MAYPYKDIATTQKGKIIYRRKRHPFGARDLHRIIKKLGLPSDIMQQFLFIGAAIEMLGSVSQIDNSDVTGTANSLIGILATYRSTAAKFEGFGGGGFGGGGATGTFWKPFPVGDTMENEG